VDQAKELRDLAKSKNLILYAFQNRRWYSDFLALRKLLSLTPSSPHYLGNVWNSKQGIPQNKHILPLKSDLISTDSIDTGLR
jgi:hypothetical protein